MSDYFGPRPGSMPDSGGPVVPARDVAGDLAEVRQLLPDGASPHEYALRVSDRRLLGAADVVLWVGPVLEPYLNSAVAGMAPGRALTAAALPGIAWPENASANAGADQGRDEHLWLDPRNARIIARALVQALAARSPGTEAALAERLRRFEAELDAAEAAIQARLAPLRGTPFASDHDGFGHFAHRFGLRSTGYLRDVSGHAAGARSVAALMGRTDVRCLVAEPNSRPERLQRGGVPGKGVYFMAAEDTPTYAELGQAIATALERRRAIVAPMPWSLMRLFGLCGDAIGRIRRSPGWMNSDKIREALAGSWTCSAGKARRSSAGSLAGPSATPSARGGPTPT